jgi:hypothetical protein
MKILESKVDINLKIAKILTNAMQWKIDFSAFKGAKYTIIFPVTAEPYAPQDRIDIFSTSPLPMLEVLNNNNDQ